MEYRRAWWEEDDLSPPATQRWGRWGWGGGVTPSGTLKGKMPSVQTCEGKFWLKPVHWKPEGGGEGKGRGVGVSGLPALHIAPMDAGRAGPVKCNAGGEVCRGWGDGGDHHRLAALRAGPGEGGPQHLRQLGVPERHRGPWKGVQKCHQ